MVGRGLDCGCRGLGDGGVCGFEGGGGVVRERLTLLLWWLREGVDLELSFGSRVLGCRLSAL